MEKWVIGIDEVGRGPLAGPVTVCAIAIPEKVYKKAKIVFKGFKDSKKYSEKRRGCVEKKIRKFLIENSCRSSIKSSSALNIDKIGIIKATLSALNSSIRDLKIKPEYAKVLLDGLLKAPFEYKNQKTIIKGDEKELVIAMASILAKIHRDSFMKKIAKKFPEYFFAENKGYGTKKHLDGIKKFGLINIHRKTYIKL